LHRAGERVRRRTRTGWQAGKVRGALPEGWHKAEQTEDTAKKEAIPAPRRGGDERNHHVHLLRTTRKVEADGLGAKLDTEKAGRNPKKPTALFPTLKLNKTPRLNVGE
jgi:hypothetical protein